MQGLHRDWIFRKPNVCTRSDFANFEAHFCALPTFGSLAARRGSWGGQDNTKLKAQALLSLGPKAVNFLWKKTSRSNCHSSLCLKKAKLVIFGSSLPPSWHSWLNTQSGSYYVTANNADVCWRILQWFSVKKVPRSGIRFHWAAHTRKCIRFRGIDIWSKFVSARDLLSITNRTAVS